MNRETCIECEKIFVENMNINLEDFLDNKISDNPEIQKMCTKNVYKKCVQKMCTICFVRIINRLITK